MIAYSLHIQHNLLWSNMFISGHVRTVKHIQPSSIIMPDEYALDSFVDSVCQKYRRFEDDLPRTESMLGHQSDLILRYVQFYVV
jgi:hypothetical protein